MNATRKNMIAAALASIAMIGAAMAEDDGRTNPYQPGQVGDWADGLGYRTNDTHLSPDYEHGRVDRRRAYQPGFQSEWTAPLGLPADGAAEGESADIAFQRMLSTFSGPGEARWVNKLVPAASGDYVAAETSADDRLNRMVAAYDREALDRGGWNNVYAPDSNYATPNALLAADIGEGVTTSFG